MIPKNCLASLHSIRVFLQSPGSMADQPNLSRDGIQKLNFVGQSGNQLVYQGPNKKVIMLDIETVQRLGMTDSHSRKRTKTSKFSEEDTWSGIRSSSSRDRLATAKLLEILKKYHVEGELFSSKRMRKKEIWIDIASQLIDAGFQFRNQETAWEKVSQKWRNMERSYRAQLINIRNNKLSDLTRSTSTDFFEDIHELLSHKYNPDGTLRDVSRDSSIADADESQHSIFFNEDFEDVESNPESLEIPANDIEHEGHSRVELGRGSSPTEECFDTYVENELSLSSDILDDKNLVFASDINLEDGLPFNPHTSGVKDPVLRLLLEMRAQERAHFREDRRERLRLQREMVDFRRDLMQLLQQQHQERMDAMYALVGAIKGADCTRNLSDGIKFGLEKRLDKTSLELNLPNGKRKRRQSDAESSSSQSSTRRK